MKKKTSSKTFSKDRETAVILEKIYGKFKTFGEGQKLLDDKVESMRGMVARSAEDITLLKLTMYGMKDDVVKIDGKLAAIENDLRAMTGRLTVLEGVK